MTARAMDNSMRRQVAAIVEAPAFILPWLDRFYDADDATLLIAAASLAGDLSRQPPGSLERAVRRGVLDRSAGGLCQPASLHSRYEMWAFFEGWHDVPSEVRQQLNSWELDDYVREISPAVAAVRGGRDSDRLDYSFLLLKEAEELVSSVPYVYLWPCNCRAMWGNCSKPQNVCLRLENDRGIGWELSPGRAVEVLREADRSGLMHTAYFPLRHGHHGICNCCSDCCFPMLAAQQLGAADIWPVRRYVAVVDPGSCTSCGRCAHRCPFGALTFKKGSDPAVRLDPAICRGCGLCSTGCPDGAIEMHALTA
jgi:Pyruvate/2-oxoacid:ferredoxin oxidoreductase delta subunit